MTHTLPPFKDALRSKAAEAGVPLDVIEKDYGLSYVLAGIFGDQDLASTLVFKGGTALRKGYFSDYRFSVDLDFTAVAGLRGDELEAAIRRAAHEAERLMQVRGPVRVEASRRPERAPHPLAQEAFIIRIQFPWHTRPSCSLKVEITTDEPLVTPMKRVPLLHGYDEEMTVELRSYSLEEILAEKLRTPLQAQRRADEGRWVRNCARDYYDVWYLTSVSEEAPTRGVIAAILPEKCSVRGVSFVGIEDFFPPRVVAEAKRLWESSLGDLVRSLPRFDSVMQQLRGRLPEILRV